MKIDWFLHHRKQEILIHIIFTELITNDGFPFYSCVRGVWFLECKKTVITKGRSCYTKHDNIDWTVRFYCTCDKSRNIVMKNSFFVQTRRRMRSTIYQVIDIDLFILNCIPFIGYWIQNANIFFVAFRIPSLPLCSRDRFSLRVWSREIHAIITCYSVLPSVECPTTVKRSLRINKNTIRYRSSFTEWKSARIDVSYFVAVRLPEVKISGYYSHT